MNDTTQTLVRSFLKIGAGMLVAKGLTDNNHAEEIAAGIFGLFAVIWGLLHRTPKTAAAAAPDEADKSHNSGTRVPIFFLAGMLALGGLTGCATLDKNADPIEVRAEQTISMAEDTIDAFMAIEFDNDALVKEKAPAIHDFANWLAAPIPWPDGSTWPDGSHTTGPRGLVIVQSANDMRRAYKTNRSPENKASLVAALAALEETLRQVQGYINQTKSLK